MNVFSGYENGNFYHIYNHGVDERSITRSQVDSNHFLMLLELVNTSEVFGNISRSIADLDPSTHGKLLKGECRLQRTKDERLVNVVSYCLNPNHFHLILEQLVDNGISRYLHKLTMAYSKYFNTRYKRKGALFAGTFRKRHIATDAYLLHVSVYVNLNNKVHNLGQPLAALVRSSWGEYTRGSKGLCIKECLMEHLRDMGAYREYALETLEAMRQKKIDKDEVNEVGLDW